MKNLTTSFVQDQKFATKSDRFQVIQPSQIAKVLDGHGFDLVSLKTAKAKSIERIDHQTTIARYRSRDEFGINGQHFDLVFKVPHLYGSLTGLLGLFRQVCTNGLVVGTDFEMIKVRHDGNPMNQLNTLIPALVAQRLKLVDQVRAMQARDVTPQELATLSQSVAKIRLGDETNIQNIQYADLMRPRRSEDQSSDLFTVLNVLQENVMRYGVRYDSITTNEQGIQSVRNMTARPVSRRSNGEVESVRSIEINASIWNEATKLLQAA